MSALLAGYKPIWMAWPSWPGDNSEVYVDFCPVKDRRVFYLIEVEEEGSLKDLYKKAVKVYPKLRIVDELYFIERISDNVPNFLDKKDFVKKIHSMGLKLDISRNDAAVEQGLAIRSAANLGKVKDLEYVLEPIIPQNSLVLAYSTYGIGKSFTALSFAYAVTQGVNACDRLKVGKPGKILYIDSEMGEETMTERLAYVEKIFGTDKNKKENLCIMLIRQMLTGRLGPYECIGLQLKYRTIMESFLWLPGVYAPKRTFQFHYLRDWMNLSTVN